MSNDVKADRFSVNMNAQETRPRASLALLFGSTALVSVALAPAAWAQNAPGTIISSNASLTGTISGNQNGGYFVNGGTLAVSNATVSGFTTTGGAGSGGGAGLGGAIFVDKNGTVILNNVTVTNNTAVGGTGGVGTTGGSLNNLFNNGTAGATGAAGKTPVVIQDIDVGGQPGSVGLNGAAATAGIGGTGGAGGAGSNGGQTNPALIELVTVDTAHEVADTADVVHTYAELAADDATTTDDTAHEADDSAHVAADETQAGATAQQETDDTTIDVDDGVEAGDDTAEAVTEAAGAVGAAAAEAEFTDAAIATDDAIDDAAIAVEDGTEATEEGLIAAAETDKVAADGEQQAADDTEGGADSTAEAADSAKVGADGVKKEADYTDLEVKITLLAADTVAAQDDLQTLIEWDEAVSNGQLGIGGQGANGGTGGTGSEGYGGGQGGTGGAGGNGGYNEPNPYDLITAAGGAIGGNGGAGGTGGDGGFGAGGGSGGNGGAAGLGAGGIGGYDGSAVVASGQAGGPGLGGAGGFGGGNGSNGTGYNVDAGLGQGGSGYGGAVFVNAGGKLLISGSALFDNNNVIGGDSQNGGVSGQAVGTDLFMYVDPTHATAAPSVTLAPGAGQSIIFNGTIADNSVASVGNATNGNVPTGSGAGLLVAGAATGVVQFNNLNTYTGATVLQSGVLQAQDGSNIDANSNITFTGGTLQSSGLFNRFLGTASNDVQWANNGSNNGGGFSAIGSGLTVTLNGGHALTWNANNFVTGTGATLDFGSSTATANVTFTNNVNLNGNTANVANYANAANNDYAVLTGAYSNGGMSFGNATHTGVVELTGANSYAGGTTVQAGTLALANGGSLNAQGAVTVDANAIFDNSGGGNQAVGGITGGGTVYLGKNTLTLNGSTPATFSGVIADGGLAGGTGGAITVNGVSQTLTGINAYTGATTINAGADLALAGNGQVAISSGVADNGTFDISANSEPVAEITTLSGDGAVALGANTLMISAGSTSFAGGINGAGNLDVTGGTQTLTGTNSLTGMAIAGQGATLALSGAGSVADASTVSDAGTFDISGASNGGANVVSLQGTGSVALGANTLTLTQAGGEVSGVISGTGGLTVAAGGEELAGVNSYTGSTVIDPGVELVLTGAGAIAQSQDVTDNGMFDISGAGNGGASITTLDGNGLAYLGANTLTLTDAAGTFAGNVEGAGGLAVAGGAEELSAANSYAGNTTIAKGATLGLTGAGSVLNSADMVDNGTFDISAASGGGSTIQTLAGNGSAVLGGNTLTLADASTNFAGNIEGAGNLTVAAGTQTLSGQNALTGVTTIAPGAALDLAGAGGIAASSLVTDNGSLNIAGASNGGAKITTLNGNGIVVLGANTLSLTDASSTFAGDISGAGGFTVAGGTQTMTGANAYTGATTVAAGADLITGAGGSIAASSGLADAGTFDISAANTAVKSLSGNGAVKLGASTLTLSGASGNFAGDMAGTGNLTVAAGTETLSGQNGFTGLATINPGAALALSGNGGIAAASKLVDNGTFSIANASNGGASIKTLAGNGTAALGSNTLTLTGANSSFAGNISGAGNLTVAAGTQTLTGTSSYTGATKIASGADLVLTGNASILSSSGVADAGTFDVSGENNGGTTVQSLSGNGKVVVGANVLNIADQTTSFTGVLSGTGYINILNGTFTLPQNNAGSSYQGTLGVNNAAINLNSQSDSALSGSISANNGVINTATPTTITQDVAVNGSTTLNGPTGTKTMEVSQTNATTLMGKLSGSGTLATTGNVIDNGTGGTGGGATVQSGVLEVGDQSTPSAVFDGDITGVSGGTLRGHGTIAGNVSSTGNVFPGGTIGTLTVTGNYTQSPTGTFTTELTADNTAPGTGYDQLVVGGKASLAGNLALQIDPPVAQDHVGELYNNVIQASSVSGKFATVSGNQIFNGYMQIEPVYTPTAVNLEVEGTPLAYHAGNAAIASAFVDNASQFGAMDDIIAAAPQKPGADDGLVSARIGSWGVADGSLGSANGDRISDYNMIAGNGFAVTPDLTIGLAYSRNQTATKSAQDNVTGASNAGYGYATDKFGSWQLSGVFGGGLTQLTTARELATLGLQAGGAKAESFYNGTAQLSYQDMVGRYSLVPFVRLGMAGARRGVFSESGAGSLDITYAGHHGLVSAATAGARLGYSAQGDGYLYQPWVELSGTGYGGDTKLSNPETIGTVTAVQTAKAAPAGAAGIGTGINLVKGRWTGTLAYGGQFGSGTYYDTFTGTLTYRW